MQRPLTPTFGMFGLQILSGENEVCVMNHIPTDVFIIRLYLQYSMYAKLLLKAIPSRIIPAVSSCQPCRTFSEVATNSQLYTGYEDNHLDEGHFRNFGRMK